MAMPSDLSLHASSAASQRVVCDHCGLPVPVGLVEPDAPRQFCCGGCRAAYETIHACGLESYYRLRAAESDSQGRSAAGDGSHYTAFDSPTFAELYVTPVSGGLCRTQLALEGVTCGACVWLVEKLPRVATGVVEARLSLRDATVTVVWDPTRTTLSAIARTLDRLGYRSHPARGISRRELHRREERGRLVHLGVAGAIMGNTMLLGLAMYAGMFGNMEREYSTLFRWLSAILGTISLAWPGMVFFRSALSALRLRSVNLDVPIALALLVGGVAGIVNVVRGQGEIYFDSLTVLIFLLLVGRWLQFRQQRRADESLELLFSMMPTTCRIVRGDAVVESPIEALRTGDLVEVRPGELFPADGVVEVGQSSVRQALLSGESAPVQVAPGGQVFGGTQNVGSEVRVRIRDVGADTRIGRLMRLVDQGLSDKPQAVRLADRLGFWFVIVVSLASIGVFIAWARHDVSWAIENTVALLIVTCPCVLGLAAPLTLAVAMGRLARRQILVKSGTVIELLARAGRSILDKTGTITHGEMRVIHWRGDDRYKPIVAAVERLSSHPVARAITELENLEGAGAANAAQPSRPCPPEGHGQDARAATAPVVDRKTVIERGDGGIAATVDGRSVRIGSRTFMERQGIELSSDDGGDARLTRVFVAVDGAAVATILLGDDVRPDSAAAIAALRRMGWRPSILSGDAQAVVDDVAARIGVPACDAIGEVTPEAKLERVRERCDGQVTVMVGDGVNDAAALAAADVGIAVQGGAEASLAAADVYIARPGLGAIVELISTSRRTMRVLRRALLVSLAYNLLAGGLAAAGMMSPLLAAVLMPVSSATVLSTIVASMSRSSEAPTWK